MFLRVAQYSFNSSIGFTLTLTGPNHFARTSKIMARQTRSVYPWVFVC